MFLRHAVAGLLLTAVVLATGCNCCRKQCCRPAAVPTLTQAAPCYPRAPVCTIPTAPPPPPPPVAVGVPTVSAAPSLGSSQFGLTGR
jgi:hypothetical protein